MALRTQVMPALVILVALAACSNPPSTQTLSSRVAASLTPAEPCNRPAGIEYLPTGTRIQFPESSLFVSGQTDLTGCGEYALASVTEAMLDPRIMQVVIEPEADLNTPGSSLSLRRADKVKKLFSILGSAATQPPVLVQPASAQSSGSFGIVLSVIASN
jgi:hypothetical protein